MVKLGALVCLAFMLVGCATRHSPPPVPVSMRALDGLRQSADELPLAAARTCEAGCVSQIIGQCVLLAVESVEFVSPECIGDKSRACILNCAP